MSLSDTDLNLYLVRIGGLVKSTDIGGWALKPKNKHVGSGPRLSCFVLP